MEIPNGLTITVDGLTVKVKGPKGEVSKLFKAKDTSIKVNGNTVLVESPDRALRGTIEAQIRNMMYGVQNGYSRKMKIIYAHFPFTFEVKGNTVNVKNMLGEKVQRTFTLVGGTKIEVKGQDLTISGPDKDAVGQTIANMKTALKIKEKDCRVFQDGVYEVA